jgi:transcriptional regulator with GAF, ATPase, and Fis domain
MVRHRTSLFFEDNVRARQEALGIKMVGQEALSWLGVPLMIGDEVLGVMAVQSHTTPRLYDEHDRELLTAIANQVAIALQNARHFEATQAVLAEVRQAQAEAESRLQETQVLQQLTQRLASAIELTEIVQAFFCACQQLLEADYGIFSLVDQPVRQVKAVGGFNVSDDHLRRANHPLASRDIMADIVRTGQTDVITGWDPRFDAENFEAEGMAEWGLRIFTPITVRQEHIGLVEVGFKEKADVAVQENQLRLLRTLIDQAAIALESSQRYQASQRMAHREQTIREITEKMRAAVSLEQLIKTATTELGERLSAGHALVEVGLAPAGQRPEEGNGHGH